MMTQDSRNTSMKERIHQHKMLMDNSIEIKILC